ncbi:MAG TPA: hypothetical protein VHW00_01040 [Thermoanaerobaculia bacterium]|nr:hypothetical protein [Thermoanaerobaculia bacterium]
MDVEIVFSGLCAFHNVRDINSTMPEPSVILIRTDNEPPSSVAPSASIATASSGSTSSADRLSSVSLKSSRVSAALESRGNRTREEIDDEKSALIAAQIAQRSPQAAPRSGQASGGRAAAVDDSDVHIPYLAFNTGNATVDDPTGFVDVDFAPGFKLLQLNGVEIVIQNDPPGAPTVDPSYDLVLKKDAYWPEAKDQWNRDFVPLRGEKPKKTAVAGWMRFGSGTISSDQRSPVAWKFDARPGFPQLSGFYNLEVIYSGFPHSGNTIVIELRDLETGVLIRDPLVFSPVSPTQDTLTLFIGNADPNDVDNALLRAPLADMPDNDHFRFLNRVAGVPDPGILPTIVRPPASPRPKPRPPGGFSTGPCGPTSSNG